MINKKYILICLCLFLLLSGCAEKPVQEQLVESMVEMDRTYVPVLILTYLHKQKESELAFERFQKQWNNFNSKYSEVEIKYGLDITDKFWKENFEEIDTAVVSAELKIKDEMLSDAYKKLIVVRLLLKDLRGRNGIAYFLDGMTGFHAAMEEISLFLRGKSRLKERDIKQLRKYFKQAQSSLNLLADSEADLSIYGFDKEKVEAIKKRIREEQRLLAAFAATLSSKNTDLVFQAAQDLKPNFIVLYKAFGDFQPIFDQVVKERKEREDEKNEAKSK